MWWKAALLLVLLVPCSAEVFDIPEPPKSKDGRPGEWPPDKPSAWPQHKPKARAGILVARYVPQAMLAPGQVLPMANITYRIVGEDANVQLVNDKYQAFEKSFKKLYGSANLHASLSHVRPAECARGTQERPCRGEFEACCREGSPVANPITWSGVDVTVLVGISRESLWPDQGSVDWAHNRIIAQLLSEIGFEIRCLLMAADVLPEGVHAHKFLPITPLYTEETVVQFKGTSLSTWLPVDIATQNMILYSLDLVGLNRIAGCARIKILRVTQRCNWITGKGQIGVANVTFLSHREYPEVTFAMAFKRTSHILMERLNEEGLNLDRIDVVSNRPVKGPEWGNMHDQIESMIDEDDPVRVYETRIPENQLPNYKPASSGFEAALAPSAIAAAVIAVIGGVIFWQRSGRKQGSPARNHTAPSATALTSRATSYPQTSHGHGKAADLAPITGSGSYLRPGQGGDGPFRGRASAPAVTRRDPYWDSRPQTRAPSTTSTAAASLLQKQLPGEGVNGKDSHFNAFLASLREGGNQPDLERRSSGGGGTGPQSQGGADVHAIPSTGSSQHQMSTWSASTESPNPFLTESGQQDDMPALHSPFAGVPPASITQAGSLKTASLDEQQVRQEAASTVSRTWDEERTLLMEHQMARADSVASWLLSAEEIEICSREDGSQWLLGSGAYGKVYRGLRGGVQDVAVKVLHTTDELQIHQFCLEIKLLKELSFDRNIVQFLGVCLHGGSPMLVLEFMEGGDLRQALSEPDPHQRLNWSNLGQHIALDVVRGLHFLHRNRVVHGDLKSRNVLLGRDGVTAKLSDVGMSRILSGSRSTPLPGNVPGTFPYAAPELLLGQPCSVKADIFSLGVLLWEIITRQVPMRGQLRPLRVPDECSDAVAGLIEDCMHFDAEFRPGSREVFDRIRMSSGTVPQVVRTPSLASSGELSARVEAASPALRQVLSPHGSLRPMQEGDD